MIFETNRLVFKLDFRMSERSKRSRNKGNDARQAALDKIRNARQSGTVADYDIGEVDNIFEEVDEDEYEVNFLQGTNSGRAWVYFMISLDRTSFGTNRAVPVDDRSLQGYQMQNTICTVCNIFLEYPRKTI